MSCFQVEASRNRRGVSGQLKQDAVRLVLSENYSFAAAAKTAGVSEQNLHRRHVRLAPKPEPSGQDASLEDLRAEN